MRVPSFDDSPTADIDILAERNFECLMEYDAEKEEKLNFWQQARLREEEEIKKINFEEYLIRQAEIEAEELQDQQENTHTSYSGVTDRPKSAKKKKKDVFSINTQYCRSELETVQYVIQKCGFQETTAQGDLYWFGLGLSDKDVKIMNKKKCYFNRYPGSEYLARKKVFCSINNRIRRCFPKLFNFSPISFLIPEESTALENYMAEHPTFMFIGKPSCGKGGEGIMLLQKFKDIPKNVFSGE